ncbi:MAG: 5'-nucleotidase, partial [Lachnospiraceae bacterium]|nr:5'-nucleotidase [Lachnospiraceae bacterium]
MEYSLKNSMVIGVSARALFDRRQDNAIFEEQGLDAYTAYQKAHEDEILKPGEAFTLIKALLRLNSLPGRAD